MNKLHIDKKCLQSGIVNMCKISEYLFVLLIVQSIGKYLSILYKSVDN